MKKRAVHSDSDTSTSSTRRCLFLFVSNDFFFLHLKVRYYIEVNDYVPKIHSFYCQVTFSFFQ